MTVHPRSRAPAPATEPPPMVWLATNACNARCQHCSSNSARRSADELTTTEALAMVDDLAAAGVVDLTISGGEPLLRPDLFAIIDRARSLGISVGVGSNGAVLSPMTAARLAAGGVDRLQVGLNGLPLRHDALCGWPGLFDRAVRSIRTAADAGLRIHVCCTVTRRDVHELAPFVQLVSELPVRRISFSRYVPTGRGADGLDLPDEVWRAVVDHIAVLRDRYREDLDIVGHVAQQVLVGGAAGFAGCHAGAARGCIDAAGDVYPSESPIPVGNLRHSTLTDIWRQAPRLHGPRDRGDVDGSCHGSRERDRRGDHRVAAHLRTGGVFATDPR